MVTLDEREFEFRLTAQRSVTLRQVSASWAGQVERIAAERSAQPLHSWGAVDLLGVLIDRDRIHRAEAELGSLPHLIATEVQAADDLYRHETEPSGHLLIRLAALIKQTPYEGLGAPGWWWLRCPIDGPIREDIDGWVKRLPHAIACSTCSEKCTQMRHHGSLATRLLGEGSTSRPDS